MVDPTSEPALVRRIFKACLFFPLSLNILKCSNSPLLQTKNKGAGKFLGPNGKMVEIRDVWRDNLDEEMTHIRKVRIYNYLQGSASLTFLAGRGKVSICSDGH